VGGLKFSVTSVDPVPTIRRMVRNRLHAFPDLRKGSAPQTQVSRILRMSGITINTVCVLRPGRSQRMRSGFGRVH
jgi:hypothetical protein